MKKERIGKKLRMKQKEADIVSSRITQLLGEKNISVFTGRMDDDSPPPF